MSSLIRRPSGPSAPIDNVSIRRTEVERRNPVTKSPFDHTGLSTMDRPGDLKKKEVVFDPDAFTNHTTTVKETPQTFRRKGTGTGGLSGVQAKQIEESRRPPKKIIPVSQAGAYASRRNPANTTFRMFYERGDLPVYISGYGKTNCLSWKVDSKLLDYHHYLPLFFDGLREFEHPYSTLALQGTIKLLADGGSNRILPVIPQLIIPIKNALNTRDPEIVVKTLRIIRKLVEVDQPEPGKDDPEKTGLIGLALVPYYRQILPILNIFYVKNKNLGDQIDYHQQWNECIGDLIQDTLELLEQTGGEDAFINIKYLVPTYQSTLIN